MSEFSIIIPTFNSGTTLKASLDSILMQTHKDVEVIIQDGLSNDDTLEIASSYHEKISHLRVISEKDNGIYDAMNKGLEKASGEWVLFLGSDDTLYQNTVLKNVQNCIKSTSANVVYGNVRIVGDAGWAKDGAIYAGKFTLTKLLNQNICHQAMFYNREFMINKVGLFNIDYSKSADWDYNMRCWSLTKFYYLDCTVANFYGGGFSTNTTDHVLTKDFIDNIRKYFKISLFHPLINNSNFVFYNQVKINQKERFPARYKFEKLKKRLVRKLRKDA